MKQVREKNRKLGDAAKASLFIAKIQLLWYNYEITSKNRKFKKVIAVLYSEPTVNRNYLIQKTGSKSGTIKNITNTL